jgi:hypothetical protein
LKRLAYYLINNALSSLTTSESDDIIREIITNYAGFEKTDARVVRELLIERTGMIREPSPERINFIHNAFKEFLAAERFVEEHLYLPLVEHCTDPAWSPVLYFAAASPQERYVNALLDALIGRVERIGDDDDEDFEPVQVKGALLKTCAVAISVSPDKRETIARVRKDILPPRELDQVQFLAALGDDILPDLPTRAPSDDLPARALARLLAQIGTPAAIRKAEIF